MVGLSFSMSMFFFTPDEAPVAKELVVGQSPFVGNRCSLWRKRLFVGAFVSMRLLSISRE